MTKLKTTAVDRQALRNGLLDGTMWCPDLLDDIDTLLTQVETLKKVGRLYERALQIASRQWSYPQEVIEMWREQAEKEIG